MDENEQMIDYNEQYELDAHIEEQMQNIDDILNSVTSIQNVDNDVELDDAYKDQYTTKQQRLRDKEVTKLLEYYTAGYKSKVKMNKAFKITLFIVCCLILSIFSGIFSYLLFNMKKVTDENVISGIVQTITVCITFLTLVVSILKIITRYVFSDKDEEYITKIVEIIQNNDLENKKQNIMVKSKIKINNLESNTNNEDNDE